jgi:Family of unknown function (DUF6188)
MHGLPEGFDPSFLVGLNLEQICFTENQVIFHFSSDVHITVESAVAYRRGASSERVLTIPIVESDLMSLLGDSVRLATAGRDGSLAISFTSAKVLTCLDTSQQFESYQIRRGEDVLIV